MIEIRAQRQRWRDGVELLAVMRDADGCHLAEPLVMRRVDPASICSPTLTLSNQAAQKLMDELWDCGLRPSEGTGSAGSLAATERHLKDMQNVAMGLLRKNGVKV